MERGNFDLRSALSRNDSICCRILRESGRQRLKYGLRERNSAAVILLGTKGVQTIAKLLEKSPSMRPLVDTKDLTAVERDVELCYRSIFSDAHEHFVSQAFGWAQACFEGRYSGYLPIDARYHDLEHTLQGTLCMVRILHGRHQAQVQPLCTRRLFELGLLAILLHDTGYLKRTNDTEGTGAKYTLVHVRRSIDFAGQLLGKRGFGPTDIRAVPNMISCTGLNVDLESIPFQDDIEKIVGFALGTGDLLGQMAAQDYVEKLPILFEEFAEAQRFTGADSSSRIIFGDAEDLMRKTPQFWEHYVRPKIEGDFQGLYAFLNDPYPDGPNPYLARIEVSLRRLREKFAHAA